MKYCLIGEVIVDVHLSDAEGIVLGGIFHSARAFSAMNVGFDLLYIAPSYLDETIMEQAKILGVGEILKIGNVTGSPNVVTIKESKEIGSQGYNFLLEKKYDCKLDNPVISKYIEQGEGVHILIFTGQYSLSGLCNILNRCKSAKYYVDLSNGIYKIEDLENLGLRFEIVFTSYSTYLFKTLFDGGVEKYIEYLSNDVAEQVLFKENRGGSRLFMKNGSTLSVGAQLSDVAHSVGVGDVFNTIYLVQMLQGNPKDSSLYYASWGASEYSSSNNISKSVDGIKKVLKTPPNVIVSLEGLKVPWESRRAFKIYIAGPDFSDSYKPIFDKIEESLCYHNFNPILPIRENGLISEKSTNQERLDIFIKDLNGISNASLVIAVLPYEDQGTLVEIGIAFEKRIPIILFDPYRIASNNMLKMTANVICHNFEKLIDQIFVHIGKLL